MIAVWESLSCAQKLSFVAVLAGLPVATYYPLMFLKIKFWESGIGKSMITKGFALMLIFWTGLFTLPALAYQWHWFDWWQLGVNWFLVAAVWVQVIVMRGVQKSGELHARMGTNKKSESGSDVAAVDS